MNGPYREASIERTKPDRTLDPWKLALLFAWVCDIVRVGLGLLGGRRVTGELGFAALLAATTLVVVAVSLRQRSRRAGHLARGPRGRVAS
jgi:hypothetical protein